MPRPVVCLVCGRPLILNVHAGTPRKYCSSTCKNRATWARQKAARDADIPREQKNTVNDPGIMHRIGHTRIEALRSPQYEEWRVWEGHSQHILGEITDQDVAARFGVERQTVGRWKAWLREELLSNNAKRTFRLPANAAALLEPTVEAFEAFYRELMRYTSPQGIDVAPFHREWMHHLITTTEKGGRLAIQGPQRYGKTALFIAFMVWSILRNPDVRILFVARTAGLAEDSTGLVRNLFEDNQWLIKTFLPEGTLFRPGHRSAMPWTSAEFTVATRTLNLRSPTVTAVGSGGTILGRDADIILCDDLEDFRNAQTPGLRDKLKRWFTSDLTSRKMEHTGWVLIGSAQHPEDLISLLRQDPQWRVKVYSAHNPACHRELWAADPNNPSEPANPQDHEDCVLWPGTRSYRWLFSNRQTAVDKTQWDMNMLGVVADGTLEVFNREIMQAALRPAETLGNPQPGWRLVAGLDPGGGGKHGYLSAVLWGVDDDDQRHVVDLYDVMSGGLNAIRDVMYRWHRDYGLVDWVVEMNIAAAYLYDDHTLAEMRQRTGIRIIEHRTYNNKLDGAVGVPSLKEHFVAGRIHLPYGDERSRREVDELVNQFRRWSPRASSRDHYRTDLVMASWFPEATIRSFRQAQVVDVDVEYAATVYPTSYAGAW